MSFNASYDYTILALDTTGVTEAEANRAFRNAGAVYADRCCTTVAGKNSGTSWLVAFPQPFVAVDYLRNHEAVLSAALPRISYHGKLGDYFTSVHDKNHDAVSRNAAASRMIDRWLTSLDGETYYLVANKEDEGLFWSREYGQWLRDESKAERYTPAHSTVWPAPSNGFYTRRTT